MNRLPKYLAIATAALAVAVSAHAESRFEATINYAPGTTVEATYTDVSRQVARACRKELSRSGRVGLGIAYQFMIECRKELMTSALNAINDPVLTAYVNGNDKSIGQLASR